MVRIRRSRLVSSDLIRIWRWIALDSPRAADRMLQRIDRAFLLIADFPEAGSLRQHIGMGVRVVPVGRYLVIYRINDRGPLVLRVVHGAMDLTKIDMT